MKRFSSFLIALLIAFYFSIESSASEVGEKEDIRNLKTDHSLFDWRTKPPKAVNAEQKTVKKTSIRRHGNLPNYLVRSRTSSIGSESKPIRYPELAKLNKSGLHIGDILDCVIPQDIIGYVGAVSPVKAKVISGPYKGAIFVGNATLDPNTKNILVEFHTIRPEGDVPIHTLKATVHSVSGELGIEGTHHSNYWQYFLATVVSRTAQGYSETLVERQRNIFGNYQQVPTQENANKAAIAEAASSTADILTEKMRNLPEYTVVKGPIRTKIFIIEKPTLKN